MTDWDDVSLETDDGWMYLAVSTDTWGRTEPGIARCGAGRRGHGWGAGHIVAIFQLRHGHDGRDGQKTPMAVIQASMYGVVYGVQFCLSVDV